MFESWCQPIWIYTDFKLRVEEVIDNNGKFHSA